MPTRRFAPVALAAALLAASPAMADEKPAQQDPEALATDGIQSLMRAMELLIMSIPQFEAPYMNENGDIIIKRKNPDTPRTEPEPDPPRGENRKAI